jgi:hypothetical protein
VTFDETIDRSRALDRALSRPLEERMPEISGGHKLIGDLGDLFADLRKTVEEAKLGIVGAASELVEEVKELKHVETAIRGETKSVRDFKTKVLGNATGGENIEEPPK